MAGEEVFTASAIHTFGALLFFVYLHYVSKGEFWKNIWLIGGFFVLIFSFVIEQEAWKVSALLDIQEMAFSFLDVFVLMLICTLAYLMLRIMLKSLNFLRDAATGRKDGEEPMD
jgi:uncharacterized membrane protein